MDRRWRDRSLVYGLTTAEAPAGWAGREAECPSLQLERRLAASGYRWIAGVDEVGRGALAGPLVAAAVILPVVVDETSATALARALDGMRDSKALTADQRRHWASEIQQVARAIGLAVVPPAVIDAIGLGPANRLALRLAVANLTIAPDYALLDAFILPDLGCNQTALVHGDCRSLSIAAASIVAKVARDDLLTQLGKRYPAYGFERHKGYGTAGHLAALTECGPCPLHRRSFAPVRAVIADVVPASVG